MGFDEGSLVFNSSGDTFYPGQILSGRLEFDLDKVKKFRGLYIEVKGFCKVHWTSTYTRRENDRHVTHTVNHNSYEEYMNITMYLVGGKDGEHLLNPGHHVFPWECQIPGNVPSSFEGSYGHVRYEVKAVMDRPWKFDQKKEITFRVHAPMDLNSNPYCREPIEMSFEQTYCCWCMSVGCSEVLVKVPKGGWSPNELMPIEVAVTNTSSVELKIKIQFKKIVTFNAEMEPGTKHSEDVILEVQKGPIPGGTTRNWTVEQQLPDIDAPNLDNCRFIDMVYYIKVKIKTSGCHTDDEEQRPIIFGTIPIRTNYQPPMVAPQITPGLASYPSQPYPNPPIGIVPHQNYPVQNGINYPPMGPNMGVPYPQNPGNNPPYPQIQGTSPPYPQHLGSNPPYPQNQANSPPYPQNQVNNPPYPQNPITSPISNPPYPQTGLNPPYPSSPSGPVSPYPVTNQYQNSPYPSNTPYGAPQGMPQVMPALPHGTTPYPPSPFVSASAPAATSPDQEANKPIVDGSQNNEKSVNPPPPYNPDFK